MALYASIYEVPGGQIGLITQINLIKAFKVMISVFLKP